ncbi:hypothetical protein [Escherichia coli]|uniref:hypothetical protein n=1 Tax=Escherichia coli TaxID=562 RepID=UPI0028756AD3|nr:hypothetical protein [Escherichia coli]MDS0552249.1 hypothetical protein [Escherichia coli]MDS0666511.1 hypothetical protein [Escherichia coli]MDS0731955.1 hypothetical protein [Escherichia coli]MDS0758576.1 hypothetical protein [Escherichia coli]MDS0775775.1 hypothetical protein [Escherichia coli]
MNAIQKLVESILVKMGFVGAVVENIYLDSKPFRHIRFVADIPVISFLPHLVKYLKGADHLYSGNVDLPRFRSGLFESIICYQGDHICH